MGKRRRFSAEFKREAVALTGQPDTSIAQVARELGIGANMLARWRRELQVEGPQAFRGQGVARDEELSEFLTSLKRSEDELDVPSFLRRPLFSHRRQVVTPSTKVDKAPVQTSYL